jgi:hypothetical protein
VPLTGPAISGWDKRGFSRSKIGLGDARRFVHKGFCLEIPVAHGSAYASFGVCSGFGAVARSGCRSALESVAAGRLWAAREAAHDRAGFGVDVCRAGDSLCRIAANIGGCFGRDVARKAVVASLPEIEELPRVVRASLSPALPRLRKACKKRGFDVAIDVHHQPYYGQRQPGIVRGKARQGTKSFWSVATAALVHRGERLTLAVVPVTSHRGDDVLANLWPQVKKLRLKIRRLLLDRGFYSAEVVTWAAGASDLVRDADGPSRSLSALGTTRVGNSPVLRPRSTRNDHLHLEAKAAEAPLDHGECGDRPGGRSTPASSRLCVRRTPAESRILSSDLQTAICDRDELPPGQTISSLDDQPRSTLATTPRRPLFCDPQSLAAQPGTTILPHAQPTPDLCTLPRSAHPAHSIRTHANHTRATTSTYHKTLDLLSLAGPTLRLTQIAPNVSAAEAPRRNRRSDCGSPCECGPCLAAGRIR